MYKANKVCYCNRLFESLEAIKIPISVTKSLTGGIVTGLAKMPKSELLITGCVVMITSSAPSVRLFSSLISLQHQIEDCEHLQFLFLD
jgi:hypothetical protein